MKSITSLVFFCVIVLFSCTDRDDNLAGVQIRVQNTTGTTFSEVSIDSLLFSDLQPDEVAFYQKNDSLELPRTVILKGDSINRTVVIDTMFEIDSIKLNLFTYQISGLSDTMALEVKVLKD